MSIDPSPHPLEHCSSWTLTGWPLGQLYLLSVHSTSYVVIMNKKQERTMHATLSKLEIQMQSYHIIHQTTVLIKKASSSALNQMRSFHPVTILQVTPLTHRNYLLVSQADWLMDSLYTFIIIDSSWHPGLFVMGFKFRGSVIVQNPYKNCPTQFFIPHHE